MSQLPTLIFESDGSHGLGDWLGLINAINGSHRVCVWDKLGLGFSDYLYYEEVDNLVFFSDLMDALMAKEPDYGPPYLLVG